MKNIFVISIVLTIGIFSFTSCKKGHPKKVATIDSLLIRIDSSTTEFNKINRDSINAKNTFFKNSLPTIAIFLEKPVEPDELNMLQRWGQNKKPFRNFLEKKDQFDTELEFSKKQLESLKQSLKTNEIPKDSIDIYLNQETIAAKHIISETIIAITMVNKQVKEFDTLKPLVNKFIEKYTQIKIKNLNK
ncbi:MAG: hypothetical protein WCK02_03465 [Bacteroidota bacterium]